MCERPKRQLAIETALPAYGQRLEVEFSYAAALSVPLTTLRLGLQMLKAEIIPHHQFYKSRPAEYCGKKDQLREVQYSPYFSPAKIVLVYQVQ